MHARRALFGYIGYYNTERRRSSLGTIALAEFERRWRAGIEVKDERAPARHRVIHRRPVRRKRSNRPSVDNAHRGFVASLATLFVDGAYAGQWAQAMQAQHGIHVEVVRSPANRNTSIWQEGGQGELFTIETRPDGFIPLAKRWVVERTHAWNERARRLIMHHDRLNQVAEAWV